LEVEIVTIDLSGLTIVTDQVRGSARVSTAVPGPDTLQFGH
jgi:hypothetical protein